MTIAELFPKEFLRIIGITKQSELDKLHKALDGLYQEISIVDPSDGSETDTVANAIAIIIELTSPQAKKVAVAYDKVTKNRNFDS